MYVLERQGSEGGRVATDLGRCEQHIFLGWWRLWHLPRVAPRGRPPAHAVTHHTPTALQERRLLVAEHQHLPGGVALPAHRSSGAALLQPRAGLVSLPSALTCKSTGVESA